MVYRCVCMYDLLFYESTDVSYNPGYLPAYVLLILHQNFWL